MTEDRRAEAIASPLVDKAVAQCDSGAAVKASDLNGVQAKLKETIPQALFVHCYAHILNLVMAQGASKVGECKVFFSYLSGFSFFFSHSAKRTKLLDDICQRKFP